MTTTTDDVRPKFGRHGRLRRWAAGSEAGSRCPGAPAPAKVAATTTEYPIHLQSALAHRSGPPRQLTLPGQAATADGPLDMTMMFARRDLRAMRHV